MPASKLAPTLPGWPVEHPLLAIQLLKHPISGPVLVLREYRECLRIAFSRILTHCLWQTSTEAYALEERWFAVACRTAEGLVAPTVDIIEPTFGFDRDFGKFLGPNPEHFVAGSLDEHIRPAILLATPPTTIGITGNPDAPLLLELAEVQLFEGV